MLSKGIHTKYLLDYKHGRIQQGIEKRIGGEELIKLHEEAHKVRKYTREELKDIIELYKQKVKDVRGINKK